MSEDSVKLGKSTHHHYVFEWTKTKHRRVGPFDTCIEANDWVQEYHPWSMRRNTSKITILTEEEARSPLVFVPIDLDAQPTGRVSSKEEVNLLSRPSIRNWLLSKFKDSLDTPRYFVMCWDTNEPYHYGPINEERDAYIWASAWSFGRYDFRCEVRYVSPSQIVAPVEVIDPITARLNLL